MKSRLLLIAIIALIFSLVPSVQATTDELNALFINVTGITLDQSAVTMTVSQKVNLVATIDPPNASNPETSWSSSNKRVAAVSSTGTVTAVKSGTATITVTTTDGKLTSKCIVTVTNPLPIDAIGIILDQSEISMVVSQKVNLIATVVPPDATNTNVIWYSSNKKVAAVSTVGAITAIKPGTAIVTATTKDGKFAVSCTVSVSEYAAPQDQPAPTGLVGVAPGSSIYPTGKITGTTTAMEFKPSTSEIYIAVTGPEIIDLNPGTYHVRYAAKVGFNAGAVATVVVPIYVAPPQDQLAPVGLQGWAPTTPSTNTGKITGTTMAMEYKLSTEPTEWTPATEPEIIGLGSGNYDVRYAAKAGFNAGAAAQVVVPVEAPQAAPIGLIGVTPTTTANNDGRILYAAATMEYKLSTAADYISVSGIEITGLAAGTYNVRYEAVTGYSAGTPSDVVVPALSNQTAAAKLIFTFEDAWKDNITNAWPILNKAGFKGTAYINRDIVTQLVPNPEIMSMDQLNSLYSYGWDVSNHTANHLDYRWNADGTVALNPDGSYVEIGSSTTQADLAAMKAVYQDNQNWLITSGWTRSAYNAAYPSGLYSAPLIEILKNMGVLTGQSTIEDTPGTNQAIPVTNFFELPVQFVETEVVNPGTNLADVKAAIDYAVANGTTSVLMLHKVEPTKLNENDLIVTIADLQAIVDYAKAKTDANQLSVMTMSEWYNAQPSTPVTGVGLNKSTTSILVGGEEWLTANFVPNNAKNKIVTWTSSNSGVASVDETGRVFGESIGTAVITATTADGGFTANCTVTVTQFLPLTITPPTLTLSKVYDGNTSAVVTPGTLSGVVAGDVVTVSAVANYNNSAVGTGKTITVVYTLGGTDAAIYIKPNNYTSTNGVIIPASVAVTGVTLDLETVDLTAGGMAVTLVETAAPAEATNKAVTWSSSNEAVATVSGGQVTPVSAGSATITVTTDDGGFTDTCEITVVY